MRVNSPSSKTVVYSLLGNLLYQLGGPRTKSIINPWRAGRRVKRAGINYTNLGGMPGGANYLNLGRVPRPRQTVGEFIARNAYKMHLPKPKPPKPGFWTTLFTKGWDAATEQTADEFKNMSFWDKLWWSTGFSSKGPGFFQSLLTPAMAVYLAGDTVRLYNQASTKDDETFRKFIEHGMHDMAKSVFPERYKQWERGRLSNIDVNKYHSFN